MDRREVEGLLAAQVEPTVESTTRGRKVRVLLVDDQEMVRRGLRMRLAIEPDIEVVGESGDGRITTLVADLAPDVVVMDVSMPLMDGVEATKALRESAPGVAVVMLSLHDDSQTRGRSLAAGAVGFVAKHQPEGELVGEIRRASRIRTAPTGDLRRCGGGER